MATLLLFEELMLVGTHPEKGKRLIQRNLQASLAMALMIDGLLEDCIEPTQTGVSTRYRATEGEGGFVGMLMHETEVRINAHSGRRGEPVLANWLNTLLAMRDLEARVMKQLEEKGLVTQQKSRSSGLFVKTIYPHVEPRRRADIVTGLTYLLANQHKPTAHQALLIKILSPSLFYMQLLEGIPGHSRNAAAQHFFTIVKTPVYHFGIEELIPADLAPRLNFRSNGNANAAQVVSDFVETMRLGIASSMA